MVGTQSTLIFSRPEGRSRAGATPVCAVTSQLLELSRLECNRLSRQTTILLRRAGGDEI